MQVVANLDESDVGRIRPDQTVSFRVDAYPSEMFHGTVSQVRLEPNGAAERRHLRDGHRRAEQRVEAQAGHDGERQRRDRPQSSNVLRVPNPALRFRPTNEMYAALGQTPPEPAQRGDGGTRRGGPASRRPRLPPATRQLRRRRQAVSKRMQRLPRLQERSDAVSAQGATPMPGRWRQQRRRSKASAAPARRLAEAAADRAADGGAIRRAVAADHAAAATPVPACRT